MAVYLFLTDGFEETEALTTADILRRAAIDVSLVSLTGQRMVCGKHKIRVEADMLFEDGVPTDGEMIILPGGAVLPGYHSHAPFLALVRQYAEAGRFVAAICAAPTVLSKLGLLDGRTAVCYPDMAAQLTGAQYGTHDVEQDGAFITARCAGVTVAFALKLVEVLRGTALANEVAAAFAGGRYCE